MSSNHEKKNLRLNIAWRTPLNQHLLSISDSADKNKLYLSLKLMFLLHFKLEKSGGFFLGGGDNLLYGAGKKILNYLIFILKPWQEFGMAKFSKKNCTQSKKMK